MASGRSPPAMTVAPDAHLAGSTRAPAIHAAVFETRSTATGQLPPERFPGAVEPDSGIARRYSRLLGEGPDAQPVEVYPANRCPILRLQSIHQAHHATAHDGLELLIVRAFVVLEGKTVQGPTLRILPAIMVGEGITKYPVKPGRG